MISMDFDKFIDAEVDPVPDLKQPLSVPPQPSSYPDAGKASYVVIDEKSYKAGLLFGAINKGSTTLSFNHGKGLKIIRNGDWVTIQIIDAGCGKKIKHQSAPYSAAKSRTSKTRTGDVKGQQSVKNAW